MRLNVTSPEIWYRAPMCRRIHLGGLLEAIGKSMVISPRNDAVADHDMAWDGLWAGCWGPPPGLPPFLWVPLACGAHHALRGWF